MLVGYCDGMTNVHIVNGYVSAAGGQWVVVAIYMAEAEAEEHVRLINSGESRYYEAARVETHVVLKKLPRIV